MKDVVNKIVQQEKEVVFNMKLKRSQFLVKNFTAGTISVKLGDNDTASTIGANSWEQVFNNIEDGKTSSAQATNIVKVTATQTGMVEVASIDF